MLIGNKLRGMIMTKFKMDGADVQPDTGLGDILIDDRDWDMLLQAIQQEFGVEISFETSETFSTVSDMQHYIETHGED